MGATNDLTTSTFGVSGMTCAHCVASVTDELGRLEGAESVQVELVTGGVSLVTLVSTRGIGQESVAAAIDEAGYELVAGPR